MKLNGIEKLHKDMKFKDIDRQQFLFRYNNVVFDVIFFTDETPFKLIFGVKRNNFYFEINVEKGYKIDIFLKYIYSDLCKALELKYDPNNPFKTSSFFMEFDMKTPHVATHKNRPRPQDIVYYKRNVEEADKIYFYRWLDNNLCGNHVSNKNLEKTHKLLGSKAYEACKRRNISSRWTDDPTKEQPYSLP